MYAVASFSLDILLETAADLHELFSGDTLSALAEAERPNYRTNYIGSKQKLVDWIWKNTPEGVRSVFDAFSGSSVVGYMYKRHGLRVVANDRLAYCHHIARAIIENSEQTLTEADLDLLIGENGKAGDFVQRNFKGIYFAAGVHRLIDLYRANADRLDGYKKDIALFALGKSCITAKAGFGHFNTAEQYGEPDSPKQFQERFLENCRRISGLVFSNGKKNRALHGETPKVATQARTDLAYFDPPYVTQFSNVNYERAYHFVEGLMTNWEGKEVRKDTTLRTYVMEKNTLNEATAGEFFTGFLGSCAHIPYWLISYRDKSFPTEQEIKRLVGGLGKQTRMRSVDHHYQIGGKHGEASDAKERLFICYSGKGNEQVAALVKEASEGVDGDGSAKGPWVPDDFEVLSFDEDEDEGSDDLEVEADGEEEDHLTSLADLDLLASLHAEAEHVRVTQYMGNKLFMLDMLWKNTPKDAESILDAFSGGGNVAYFYKQKGLKVVANDKLAYPHHIARAVIENSTETLTDADVELLLAENPKARTFIVDEFHGYYWNKPILAWLDNVRSNIEKLSGYKRDLALFALGRTCTIHARFGQFSRSKKSMTGKPADESRKDTILGNMPLADFVAQFRKVVGKINALVFDNGQKCVARRGDVIEALNTVEADVCYCDPPYVTEFGTNDYEANLHFVEGLMSYWEDKELRDNPRRDFASTTRFTKESIRTLFSDLVEAGKKRFGHFMISYRDRAFPTQDEITSMLGERFASVKVRTVDVRYNIVKWDAAKGGREAKELLFVAQASKGLRAAASHAQHLTTRIIGDITPIDERRLSALAELAGADSDPNDKLFQFILCHEGMNRNGDFFSAEELQKGHPSIVNKKVNVKHSQDVPDYVGAVRAANLVTDQAGMRVEALGKLYAGTTPLAALSYKLMKDGVIAQVSMECEYQEGECSICGKRAKTKAEYCIHLKNAKGGLFQGKPCYEILHGVAFSGVGLLDRKGADENARILQVASLQPQPGAEPIIDQPSRSTEMNPQDKQAAQEEAAKKKDDGGGGDSTPTDAPQVGEQNKDVQIKALQKENASLKQQVADLQKQLQKMEQDAKAAANRTRAEKLVKKAEKSGVSFGDDEDRGAEIDRLASLSDEAFAAAEQTYERLAQRGEPEKPAEASASRKSAGMAASASVRPRMEGDKPLSLEEQLKQGLGKAWAARNNYGKE